MNNAPSRREFLAAAAAAGVGTLAVGRSGAASATAFRTALKKSMIGLPTDAKLTELKQAGFDGIESTHKISAEDAANARATAEKLGLKIHSVLRGWMSFNDPAKIEADVADVSETLRIAQILGAQAILVVPCRVGGSAKPGKPGDLLLPEPWEFDIEFDEKTGMVSRVVKGDNSKYADYIEAQNKATRLSREAVKKLIPMAEKTGVVVALENVWNNLWVQPRLFANFVASFDNPWIQAYFDIGNHVKYAPPQDWIKALGKLIVKCHVKDFQLNPDGHGGKFVHPRDGSINWPVVRRALDDVGYNGWLTIEDGGLPLGEFSQRLDLIIAGK